MNKRGCKELELSQGGFPEGQTEGHLDRLAHRRQIVEADGKSFARRASMHCRCLGEKRL